MHRIQPVVAVRDTCRLRVAALLLAAAGLSHAAEFVVSPTGNDTAAGTLAAPWRTLVKAVGAVGAGDTIWMRGGVHRYTESAKLAKVADAGAWITIDTWPADLASGGRAILDGSDSSGTDSKDDWNGVDAFYGKGGRFWRIRNLEVRNVKRFGFNTWEGGSDIEFSDCDFHGIHLGAIHGSTASSNVTVQRCRIYDCVRANRTFAYDHDGGWPSVVQCGASGYVIRDSHIYENWGEGIGCYRSNQTVVGNVLHDNYSVEIYVNNVTDSRIEGNLVYSLQKTAYYRTLDKTTYQAAVGIQCANEVGGDTAFRNNRIVNNIVLGTRRNHFFWWSGSGGGLIDSVIANNVFAGSSAGNGGAVVKIENGTHANSSFANNIVVRDAGTIVQGSGAALTRTANCWWGGAPAGMAGTGDVLADPRFVAPGSNIAADYKLQTGSPCIGVGTTIAAIATDFGGGARSAPYDIGAWESAGGGNASPSVALTAPANGAVFTAPASIALAASASDGDGTIAKVEFFQGTTRLGEDTTAPYAFAWTGVAAGTWQLSAKATDNAGATTTSAAVAVTVGPAGAFSAKINFQPAQAPAVAGWAVDGGAAYGDRGAGLTYGWVGGANAETRDRNSANAVDQLHDTLNHLQKGAARTWEIAVPDGAYVVRLTMGDPAYTNQVNAVRIETTQRADPDGQDRFDEHEATVTVTDGKLTIAPGDGASNAKVCSIEVQAVPVGVD